VNRLTRKQLLGAAAAGAAVGPGLLRPLVAQAQTGDPNITAMENTIRAKQLIVVAYERLAATASPGIRGLLATIVDQERQHVAALLVPTEYIGGLPPTPPALQSIEKYVPQLRRRLTGPAALKLAEQLEQFTIRGLLGAQRQLTDAKLIEVTGEVLGCDAQHLAVVRRQLGENPIPRAFETGQTR
jgi:hypothetical protein